MACGTLRGVLDTNKVSSRFSSFLSDETGFHLKFEQTNPNLRPGIFKDGERIYISDESKRLLTDSLYRTKIYPRKYSFEAIPAMVEEGDILKTLWYLVNLFDENQLLTLQLVKDLSESEISAKHYVNAFHTYIFADPEIMSFEKGQMALIQPELMNRKVQIVNFLGRYSNKMQEKKTLENAN